MAGLSKKEVFWLSFKLKVLEEAKIPHEMVKKKRGGENRAVIVCMPVLIRPFLIIIAFSLEFYSPSFSILKYDSNFLVVHKHINNGHHNRSLYPARTVCAG